MEKTISEEELQNSDGQEGRPAYVAYQGKVYDVSGSRLWRQGTHVRRHNAGNDLTADLAAAPHGEEVFAREHIQLLGRLVAAKKEEEEKRSGLLDFYFDQHPHPVAVHFPVALATLAAIFVVLYLLTDNRPFETTVYYLLWAVLFSSILSTLSGAISWWFNYGRKLTPKFRGKIGLAFILMILDAIALLLRVTNPDILANRERLGWTYFVLVMLMFIVVAIQGRLGAKITFPSRR